MTNRRMKMSKLILDEAIKHCLEVAEENDLAAGTYELLAENNHNAYERLTAETNSSRCAECAADHRQLAEWLTELKEAKRLLKMAVEDISKMSCNNDTHSPDSCYICDKHGNCSYADSFKWCKADEVLKLIGDSNDEP
jgi:hypothetical protein